MSRSLLLPEPLQQRLQALRAAWAPRRSLAARSAALAWVRGAWADQMPLALFLDLSKRR